MYKAMRYNVRLIFQCLQPERMAKRPLLVGISILTTNLTIIAILPTMGKI